MNSSDKAEIVEKIEGSLNAAEEKVMDGTVNQSVPESCADEKNNTNNSAGIVNQSVPESCADEKDNANNSAGLVNQSVPESCAGEKDNANNSAGIVNQSVPESCAGEKDNANNSAGIVNQSVPESCADEKDNANNSAGIVNQSVPESCADEKDNANNSADSNLKILFERNEESQEKAENQEKVHSKEMQELKQANKLDKCNKDCIDDCAEKSYNAGMLDEKKRDEISVCGKSEEGREVEGQEVTEQKDVEKESSDKGKQKSDDSQNQNINMSHYSNQNDNYCDDAPKSEVASDKVGQKVNNDGISSVIMEDLREGVQQEKTDDKEQATKHKKSYIKTGNADLSECSSYENELNVSDVYDKQSEVDDKTNDDQSEIISQSAVPRKDEFQVFTITSEEEQEKRDRDIIGEKGSMPRSDSNNGICSDENVSLKLLNNDSQSMSVDTTKHSTGQVNIESIVDISIKSHEDSCLKPSDDTTVEDQTKISVNSSSPPEPMDTSEVSITRRAETIVLPDEESSNINKPLFDKIKILKAEENSNTSTGDERSVESSAIDNSCLNTPQEENSCMSFPDESSILSFMDESSGISVPDSEPNFLQYQRRQNLSLFDEAANLSAPGDKCFQRPDTPSSAVTETQDSTPAKKPRRSSISSVTQDLTGDDHGPLKAENLYEYQWPQEPDADWYMLQEHVSEFLEVKSFKRKYPDLFRRVCDKHEKDFLREKGVVTETQSDLGLTALKSDEVHDFMARDYPEKYRDYMKVLHEREKQNISNKHRDYEVPKLEKGKIKEYTKKAVKAAAEWNRQFQRERKEERRAYFDVQTFTVHYPVSRYKKIPVEATKVDPYPVALIPGQFQEYYRRYSKEELKYFPLNTALFDPPKRMDNNLANPADADSEDQEEEGKQAGSGSESDSGDDSSSNSDGSSNSEETPMEVETLKPESAVSPKLEPEEAQCRICKTKAEKKKKIKKKDEELVQCSECKSLGHPSCLDLTNKMIAVIKTYPWQCMECKTCVECMDPYDEDKMMFCDRCDRGYHTFCVGLKSLPTGKWECVSCKSAPSTPKATPKSTTKSKRGRKKENGK